jgi:aminoglycoside phosphotransferase (APT) family kinase protein
MPMAFNLHNDFTVLGEGLSGRVIDLEDGIVAKQYHQSATHDALEHAKREYHYLCELNRLEFSSPTPVFLNNGPDELSLGMQKARGDFREDIIDLIQDEDTCAPIASSLAETLAELHQKRPVSYAAGFGRECPLSINIREVEAFDPHEPRRRKFYNAIKQALAYHSEKAELVFCHGDINGGNVFFKPQTCEVKGLVDFAYSGYGIPEIDLRNIVLFKGFSEVFKSKYQNLTGYCFSEDRERLVELVRAVKRLTLTEQDMRETPSFEAQNDRILFAKKICVLSTQLGLGHEATCFSALTAGKPAYISLNNSLV